MPTDESDLEYEHRWLKGDEQLFGDTTTNVLNADIKYDHGFYFFAAGFRRSAEMLFDSICRGSYADSQYFTLAFIWRQSIELQLKGMIESLDQLNGVRRWRGPPRRFSAKRHPEFSAPIVGHDLRELWSEVQPQLLKIFPGDPETNHIARVIEQFHAVDPGAEEFRYPTRWKDGSRTLSEVPRVVNLAELQEVMLRLWNVLEAASCEIQLRLEHKAHSLSE